MESGALEKNVALALMASRAFLAHRLPEDGVKEGANRRQKYTTAHQASVVRWATMYSALEVKVKADGAVGISAALAEQRGNRPSPVLQLIADGAGERTSVRAQIRRTIALMSSSAVLETQSSALAVALGAQVKSAAREQMMSQTSHAHRRPADGAKDNARIPPRNGTVPQLWCQSLANECGAIMYFNMAIVGGL